MSVVGEREGLSARGRVCQWVQVLRLAAVGLSVFAAADQGVLRDTAGLLTVAFAGSWFGLHRWAHRPGLVAPSRRGIYLALDTAVAATLILGIGPQSPILLYGMGSGVLAGLLYSTRAAAATAAILTVAVVFATWMRTPDPAADVLLLSLPPLGAAAGHALKVLLDRQEADAERIAELDAAEAAAAERMHLARELHDGLTKSLHGVAMSAQADASRLASGRLAPDEAAGALAKLARMVDASALQARTLIHQTRTANEPLTIGLWRAIEQSPHLDIEVRLDPALDDEPVPASARADVVAVLTEALHNVHKHAPEASATVDIRCEPDLLVLNVVDDGPGFDTGRSAELLRSGHFGLAGMNERAARAGGSLSVTSRLGEGTRVQLSVPVTAGKALSGAGA